MKMGFLLLTVSVMFAKNYDAHLLLQRLKVKQCFCGSVLYIEHVYIIHVLLM